MLTVAQGDIKPSMEQSMVLNKAITVIQKVLDQFDSKEWDRTTDFFDGNVSIDEDSQVPLRIREDFNRIYQVNDESDRFRNVLKPLMEKLAERTRKKIYDSITSAMTLQVRDLSYIAVDVDINREFVPFYPGDTQCIPLNIKGAKLSCKVPFGVAGPDMKGSSCWIVFGNWDAAIWNMETHQYRFPFAHPAHTPFIENMVVMISGADDRILEMLKSINWEQMNAGLTVN